MNAHVRHSVAALLDSLDPDEAAANSFGDFHVPGLDYLCLFRSPRYTAKVYFVEPGTAHNAEGNLVNPHSHGYAFRQTVLEGALEHVRLERDSVYGQDWRVGDYRSPLATGETEARLDWRPEAEPWLGMSEFYEPGTGYFLTPDEVHTIRVPRGAVLFTEQYADAGLDSTLFLSREPVTPDLSGLYRPLSVGRVCELMRWLREIVSADHVTPAAEVQS